MIKAELSKFGFVYKSIKRNFRTLKPYRIFYSKTLIGILFENRMG